MRTYFEIFRIQLKNNFIREAVYRAHFLTAFTVDAVWIALEFSLFSILYANTPLLAGWTQNQVFFFLGIFFLADAFFTLFFQTNFWNFSNLVNQGDLDFLLTKPVHPLFLALTKSMNLTASLNCILGAAIIFKFSKLAGFQGGWKWLELILWLFVSVLTALLLRFTFNVSVFWTSRSSAFSRLYYQFFTFATKPDALYPKLIRSLILTILPFGFIASVPARALLYGLSFYEYLGIIFVLLAFFLGNSFLWRRGLRRYQSASS